MKILQITSTFFPVIGGQEKVVEELSRGLKKLGHEVTILTTDLSYENQNLPKRENFKEIEIIRCKNDLSLGSYGYSKEAIKWLKENWKKYDLIHSHGYNRFLSEFAVYYLRNKKPVVFTPHGFIHTKKNYFFKIIHDLTIGRFIKYAKICTALTKLDFKEYKKLGIDKKKIIEIPNGINKEFFDKINNKELNKFKKKYGINRNFLLYVGRIHKSKGLQYVVEAIRELDCQFVIVGQDTGYQKELMKIINEKKLRDKVIFSGPLNEKELLKAYKSSDVFILFSEWEGFGIVIIEAMATGKPVIVSNRGSLPFLVKNNKNGLIVNFKDVEKLKKSINLLLKDKKLRNNLGKEGVKISKNYKWDKITKDYEKIYQDIK